MRSIPFSATSRPSPPSPRTHTVLVDSLSKRVAPGLGLGFIVAAPAMLPAVAQALRTGPWAPAGLALAFGEAWLRRPDLRSFDEIKRRDAAQRQVIARRALGPLAVHGDERAYHLYVDLPAPWRAEVFAAAASRRGIAVTPAGNFAIQPGHAPPAIRIALSSPPPALLEEALRTLSAIALAGPDVLRAD